MANRLYSIHCLTNLHVGSGDSLGVADNMVQRDPISDWPVIHGSSLKGALREYFEHSLEKNDAFIKKVFGGEMEIGARKTEQGSFRFFSAHIISLPMRSNKRPYYNVTCPQALKNLSEIAQNLKISLSVQEEIEALKKLTPGEKALVFDDEAASGKIEDINIQYHAFLRINELRKLLGDCPALVGDSRFSDICRKGLPVIARNHLENGKSTNLWYEEIVPRESRFIFGVIGDDVNEEKFDQTIASSLVQIGGNASVGYGFTKIGRIA